MNVVHFENVFKEYTLGDSQVHALKNINLKIEDGEFRYCRSFRQWKIYFA